MVKTLELNVGLPSRHASLARRTLAEVDLELLSSWLGQRVA